MTNETHLLQATLGEINETLKSLNQWLQMNTKNPIVNVSETSEFSMDSPGFQSRIEKLENSFKLRRPQENPVQAPEPNKVMRDEIHFMVDFETLALSDDAKLLSMGVAVFGKKGIFDTLYFEFDETDAGYVDPETEHWWNLQSEKGVYKPNGFDKVSSAMHAFIGLLNKQVYPNRVPVFWSQGSMDVGILKYRLNNSNIAWPFKYYNLRDSRTLRCSMPAQEKEAYQLIGPQTNKHHALHDAVYQAKIVLYLLNQLNYPWAQEVQEESK